MKTFNRLFAPFLLLLTACGGSSDQFDATGVFEATEVIVAAQASGPILWLSIEEGMSVTTDSLIGCIDTTQLHLNAARLRASRRALSTRTVNIEKQVASLRRQIALQRNELDRFRRLLSTDGSTQKQVDDLEAQTAILERQLEAQIETLTNANQGWVDEQEGLALQVAQIEDQISRSLLRSPLEGTVIAKYTEPGEQAAAGRPLFKVADLRTVYLRAYIVASQLTDVRIGQEVEVAADRGESDRKGYKGRITWISDKAEFTPKTILTRDERANTVYPVKIAVVNDGTIKQGMYGEVKF